VHGSQRPRMAVVTAAEWLGREGERGPPKCYGNSAMTASMSEREWDIASIVGISVPEACCRYDTSVEKAEGRK
jgi:hypothetical protein